VTSRRDLGRAWGKIRAALRPIEEPEPNLFVMNPLAVPAYGRSARVLNARMLRYQVRRAMRQLGFERVINWSFLPTASVVAGRLGEDRIIYHCVDEFTAFDGVSTRSVTELENTLLRKADLVIVSAQRLLETKGRLNHRTHLVRHGVDLRHFRRALNPDTRVPSAITDLPRPVLGYFGLMGSDWIDVELMTRVARHFSHGSVVMLGKVTTDLGELPRMPNVHLPGRVPYADLPGYCKGFDAALIPFPVSEVTLNANPLKAREYLAAGLPVVSTPIPEVEVLGECRIAGDPDAFIAEVEASLAEPGPSAARSKRMKDEAWDARLAEIEELIFSLDD
jgi:glycosyltransferase involved in cell wall biosynthesis